MGNIIILLTQCFLSLSFLIRPQFRTCKHWPEREDGKPLGQSQHVKKKNPHTHTHAHTLTHSLWPDSVFFNKQTADELDTFGKEETKKFDHLV